MKSRVALLSFDIEEFDLPTEYGRAISPEEQISVSTVGLRRILQLLKEHDISATFYTTAVFAENRRELVKQIIEAGHEIASHGYCHGVQLPEHLSSSKECLEAITGVTVKGYRAPRMGKTDNQSLLALGYRYNSSMNPTFIPGRYNNLSQPRRLFFSGGVVQLPASVCYPVRFPLFWLSFNNLAVSVYSLLSLSALRKDGYLNIYFHPWEFNEQITAKEYDIPRYITRHAGMDRINRLSQFISYLKKRDVTFMTTSTFLEV